MVSLGVSTAIFIYLFFSLAMLFFLWVRFEKGDAFAKYQTHHKELWKCKICSYDFVDSLHEAIARCPQCQSLNHREEEA